LHLPVGSPPHRHHEGKEHDPEEYPEKPPIPMHSPVVVHVLFISFHARTHSRIRTSESMSLTPFHFSQP
jgi:hypothetical protein